MVDWLNEKRLIPLVTMNSRRRLRNDTTRQCGKFSPSFSQYKLRRILWIFYEVSLGAYVNKQRGAEMILHGGRRRLIDRFLRQTALLCAPFYSAHVAHKNCIVRIKLKKRSYLCFVIEIKIRLISTLSWRYFSKFSFDTGIFTKFGARYSLARRLAYRWPVRNSAVYSAA